MNKDFWKSQNDKWQNEKDRLKIQLDEIDRLDREFYEKADIMLGLRIMLMSIF